MELRRWLKASKRRWLDARTGIDDFFHSRFFRQILVSAVLFILVFGVMNLPFGWAGPLQEQIRLSLSEDYDFRGTARRLVAARPWGDGLEGIPVVGSILNRTSEFVWPLEGTVLSGYGPREDTVSGQLRDHEGLDIAAEEGAAVRAAAAGEVLRVARDEGYGLYVEIDHLNGYSTLYAHTKEVFVKAGQKVQAGQVIALVGSSGNATAPHLHFEVFHRGTAVDPLTVLQGGER